MDRQVVSTWVKPLPAEPTNEAGGNAYARSDEEALAQYALTGTDASSLPTDGDKPEGLRGGAEGGTRTLTPVRTADFESGYPLPDVAISRVSPAAERKTLHPAPRIPHGSHTRPTGKGDVGDTSLSSLPADGSGAPNTPQETPADPPPDGGMARAEEHANESLLGQRRATADGSETIDLVGCYGIGSGGLLYAVTLPNSKILSPNGRAHDDVLRDFPVHVVTLVCTPCVHCEAVTWVAPGDVRTCCKFGRAQDLRER